MAHEKQIITIPPEADEALAQRFTREDLARCIKPVWEGDSVYAESVMFVPNPVTGEIDPAPLLYKPVEIQSMCSADGSVVYEEGVDYIIDEDGCICLTENTRIYRWVYDAYYLDHIE